MPIALLIAALLGSPSPIAIVVNRSCPLENLSTDDLRKLYLGVTTTLGAEHRVALGEYAPERARFYQAILAMSEDRVRRRWIARVFAGEPGAPPEEFRDTAELVRFVSTHPGAIGFVPAEDTTGQVKVVTIDGRRPGETGYRLP